jgi:hypothetical protein
MRKIVVFTMITLDGVMQARVVQKKTLQEVLNTVAGACHMWTRLSAQ